MWIIRVCYYWKQPSDTGYRAYDVILPRAYEALKNLEKNYTIEWAVFIKEYDTALKVYEELGGTPKIVPWAV